MGGNQTKPMVPSPVQHLQSIHTTQINQSMNNYLANKWLEKRWMTNKWPWFNLKINRLYDIPFYVTKIATNRQQTFLLFMMDVVLVCCDWCCGRFNAVIQRFLVNISRLFPVWYSIGFSCVARFFCMVNGISLKPSGTIMDISVKR